jgi:membrane protein
MASPKAIIAGAREKAPFLDHLIRAVGRYQADTGDRLAASVTFFGFLSFFPLLAVSVSLLSLVLGDRAVGTVVATVNDYAPGLAEQLGLAEILRNNTRAGLTGLLGLLGLLYSGLGWVDALREALRFMWHQNVLAGNFFVKKAKDVLVLAGLGVTLVVSLAISAAAGAFTEFALSLVGLETSAAATLLVKGLGTVLALATNTGLFLYLFLRLPKVQTPWRRVFKGALLAAVLFEVLKRVGAIYIERTTENPVYGTFAVVVGLLVWINLVSRIMLLCAAWTATAAYDSDVPPSGTASPEQAEKAGVPLEFADDDPDHPPQLQEQGAPSPLVAALQGRTPPQDVPEGPPSRPEPQGAAERRADEQAPPPGAQRVPAAVMAPPAGLPGEAATRTVARVGAGALSVGLATVVVYALRTLRAVLRH